jgi:hypothetical protein
VAESRHGIAEGAVEQCMTGESADDGVLADLRLNSSDAPVGSSLHTPQMVY